MCIPISLGVDRKSLGGTGIFLTTYSHTASMLYLSWADIGITGAPSATVPTDITQRENVLVEYKGNKTMLGHFCAHCLG